MTDIETMSDGLNRLVKIALDTGEATSIEEAESIFGAYRMQIVVGAGVEDNPVLQAALLTAVNCGVRAFLGGVSVVGTRGGLKVALPQLAGVSEAVQSLGARLSDRVDSTPPDPWNRSLCARRLQTGAAGWFPSEVASVSRRTDRLRRPAFLPAHWAYRRYFSA
jgi:hypothetical protein